VACAQTEKNRREGMELQRRPQQGRKDIFVSLASWVGLVVSVPLLEIVLVERRKEEFSQVCTFL